jgi:hypothetical protein
MKQEIEGTPEQQQGQHLGFGTKVLRSVPKLVEI